MNMEKFTLTMESVKNKIATINFSDFSEVRFGNKSTPISYKITRSTDFQVLKLAILSTAERCYLSNVPFTLQVIF